MWATAVELQYARVAEDLPPVGEEGAEVFEYFDARPRKQIDLSLLLVAARRHYRAAEMMSDLLGDAQLTAAYQSLEDPELKALRDFDEHFDDYLRGTGDHQPPEAKYGFMPLVEFRDPVYAFGDRSIKVSRVLGAVRAFQAQLEGAMVRASNALYGLPPASAPAEPEDGSEP